MPILGVKAPVLKRYGIKSVFFLAPINTGMAELNSPSRSLIRFHSERSSAYIGLNYIGNIAISPEYATNGRNLILLKNMTRGWATLVDAIYRQGSVPAMQFGCHNSKILPQKEWIGNVQKHLDEAKDEFLHFDRDVFNRIFDKYIENIEAAYRLGIRVFQIHAAHGYFLSNLLNKHINKRKDSFAFGCFSFFDRLVGFLKGKYSDVLLDIRVSLYKGIDNKKIELEDSFFVVHGLIKSGFDMISFSNGIYNIDKRYIYPPRQWGHAFYMKDILNEITSHPNIIFNYAGNIWDIEKFCNMPNNLTFAVGRSLIADSSFVAKSYEKRFEQINRCNFCNGCHYYSLSKPQLICNNWERISD